jgi:hypothetical protein
VAKAALISAVPPLMVKTAANPGGLPKEVFDGLQAQLAANRSQFYRDLPEGPFYGFNRPGVKASEAIIQTCGWRRGFGSAGAAPLHLFGSKYSSTPLQNALTGILGQRRLGESRTRLVIPAWHPMLERVYIYKTAYHPRLETDYKQVALEAAAFVPFHRL